LESGHIEGRFDGRNSDEIELAEGRIQWWDYICVELAGSNARIG
jgi:hypothetical protein